MRIELEKIYGLLFEVNESSWLVFPKNELMQTTDGS